MFATLFGKRDQISEPWFQASRVWSELGDICESESFGECTGARAVPRLYALAP